MNRRLIAGFMCLCVTGCALSRSEMPEAANPEPLALVDGLPTIKDQINRTDSPRDSSMKRAELSSVTLTPRPMTAPGQPNPSAPPTQTEAPSAGPAPSLPTGRPAPYSNQTPGSPRPVAPTTLQSAETAQPRPAPYAATEPSSARPLSTDVKKPPVQSPLPSSNRTPTAAETGEPGPNDQLPVTPRATPPAPPEKPVVETVPPSQAAPLSAVPPLLPAVAAAEQPAPNVNGPPPVTVSASQPVTSTEGPPPVTISAVQQTRQESAPVDTSVTQTAGTTKQKGFRPPANELTQGGQAAKVGEEVITLDQLRRHIAEAFEHIPPEQKSDPRFQKMIVDNVLEKLITRTILVQAIKKQIKDPKNLQSVYDSIDKSWVENELPPLLRMNNCANIHELKRKFTENKKSLEAIREDWRLDTLAREYMLSKIQSKLTASLPERQKYYTEHLKEFDRPAKVVWREIMIENAKCANRDEAQQKINAILVRLKKGEDFAAVAKAESHDSSARDGGKWETAPGGFGVPEVNQALANLPNGGVSTVIEVPGGFYVVKVEEKRDAGPARFDEVSDEIKETVMKEKFAKHSEAFVDNLRARTVVTTMFDQPQPAARKPKPVSYTHLTLPTICSV